MIATAVQLAGEIVPSPERVFERYRVARECKLFEKKFLYHSFGPAGKTWIDFGCGTGEIATRLSIGCQEFTRPGEQAESAGRRVVITGAAGFVGGYLADRLLQQGCEVLALDNLFNGRREHVPAEAWFEYIDLGTADESRIVSVVRDFDPDILIHLASIHYIPYCLEHPAETFLSNVRSTEVLLRAVQYCKRCRFLLASSADVYETSDQVHSEDEPVCPRNVYGLSKVLAEQLLAFGCRTNTRLSGTVLRFFNIYGPRDTTPHILPRAIELVTNPFGSEIRLGYLGGSRDFIHVFDVVDAIVASLEHQHCGCEVFNIGTGTSTGIRQAVQMIQEFTGDHRSLVEVQSQFRPFDRKTLAADIRKITSRLDWRPQIGFREGLEQLLVQMNIPLAAYAVA
jgi:UDP-glucose 4-epimerase